MKQIIGLIDCDCFFVSVERVLNPDLATKPIVVTTGGERGCIVSRSNQAKQMGAKMGIPVFMSKKECPNLIYVSGNMETYSEFSKRVMNVVKNYSPEVEINSIDEAYIDLTGLERTYKKTPAQIALVIRADILKTVGVPVSIGLATSKTLAKLASDKAKKSGGLCDLLDVDLKQFLNDTPIEEICGIGKSGARLLRSNWITTGLDLVQKSDDWLKKNMGKNGIDLKYELLGYTVYPVDGSYKPPKSIQDTRALSDFSNDFFVLKTALNLHIHHACFRLRAHNGFCRVVGVMLRTKDFAVFTDKIKLPAAMNSETDIAVYALKLLEKMFNPCLMYRSVGIMLGDLDYRDNLQHSLFEETIYKENPLSKALDALESKFGTDIVKKGYV